MGDAIYAILFVVISVITWTACLFRLADSIWGEEYLFKTTKRAIITYVVSILLAILATVIMYTFISWIQVTL